MARFERRPSKFIAAASALALALAGTVLAAPTAHADGPTSFSNTTAISVPAADPGTFEPGSASPYPSSVTVSGMAGTVSNVEVTLHGVTHAAFSDFDVLLVGPTGANMVLVSDVGETPTGGRLIMATDADLTFADGGTALPLPLPEFTLPSGTYSPTNAGPGTTDTFSAPAPTPSTMTSLAAAFNGTDPNGTWSLYIADDASGDNGSVAGGWSLQVTTAEVAQAGQLSFAAAEFRGAEGAGQIELTVQRTAGSDGAVSVDYATQNGTALAGTDYTATSGTLSFADGQTSATISVPVLDDDADLPEVALTVSLSTPQGGATIGTQSSASVVIENDDGTSNLVPITLPGGAADPYPANIHVQGQGTYLTDVDVTLHDVEHTFIGDFDILLVGPSGQSVVLLSDVNTVGSFQGLTWTFDDAAAGQLAGSLVSGTYQPTDVEAGTDTYPTPAPAGPYGPDLAVFNGTDPNGTWQLFVLDDATGDSGQITGGWELELTTATVNAGGPYSIDEGSSLTLAGSTDLAGATYAWDLDGDGAHDDATGAGPTISAVDLATLGLDDGPVTRTISVQASAGGATLTADATLTVANVAPTGTVSTNGPVLIGSAAEVTLSGLDDVSDTDLAAGLQWFMYFTGDASSDAAGTWFPGDADPTVTVPASVLDGVGPNPVDVLVTDADGGELELSTTVEVQATTPTGTFTGDVVDEGGVATVTFSGPVDAAPGAVFSYSFDFDGDGTFDVVDAESPSAAVPTSLTANGPATVTVTGRISNQFGGFSDYEADVVVRNSAPVAGISNNGPVLIGSTAEVTLTGLGDASPADVAVGLLWSVDFDGDATQDAVGSWTTGDPDPVVTVPASVLANVGSYPVSVVVSDTDGGRWGLLTMVVVQATTPTANFEGDIVDEGDPATVTFSAPVDAAPGAVFTYSFDFDGDGTFDVVDSPEASAPVPAALTADGTVTVTVTGRISNQFGGFSDYEADVVVRNSAPVAGISNNGPVLIGSTAEVTLSGLGDASPADVAAGLDWSLDFDGDDAADASGTWNTGDPDPVVSVPASVLNDVGTFVVVAHVTDSGGGEVTLSTAVVVQTTTPTATLSAAQVDEGGTATVVFSDPVDAAPGAVFTYSFDLDDDGVFETTGSSTATVPAALTAEGPATVPVTGRIANQYGGFSDYEIDVVVLNAAPTGSLSNNGPVLIGSTADVTLSGLDDVSDADLAAGLEWFVYFTGDASSDAAGTWFPGDADPVVTVPASVLDGVGSYPAQAVVTDTDGGRLELSTTLVVQATMPTATLTGDAVEEGDIATVTFSDPMDTAPGALFTYSFDFDGDGVFDVLDADSPSASVPASLTADGPATVTVTGRITNQFGGFADYEADVVVSNVAPTMTVTAPTGAQVGQEIVVQVDLDDVSSTDALAGFDVTVDFGDGTVVESGRPMVPAAFRGFQLLAVAGANEFTHSYTEAGTYELHVTAVGVDGGVVEDVRSIVIEAEPTPPPSAEPTATSSPTPTTEPTTTPSATSGPTSERPNPGRPGLPSSGV